MRKYTNPQAHGYLMEAKACDKVIQELKRIENKLQRATDKEGSARQAEFEKVMEYTNEVQIQDDYGWDLITEAQFERYMELFRDGQAALENHGLSGIAPRSLDTASVHPSVFELLIGNPDRKSVV